MARHPTRHPDRARHHLAVHALVAVAALTVLGPGGLADATAPLPDAVRAAGAGWLVPLVHVGRAVAALGSLLALILGVSRTPLAMARDYHFPYALSAVHPCYGIPHRAELPVGTVVVLLAATTEVRGVIGFSSFGVLAYYALAHASAWTLTPEDSRGRTTGRHRARGPAHQLPTGTTPCLRAQERWVYRAFRCFGCWDRPWIVRTWSHQ